MHIWLLHAGETLPIDENGRAWRNGNFGKYLATTGHTVTQWAPTFSHQTKTQRTDRSGSVDVRPGHRIELLYAPGYKRHVGWKRHRFHQRVAAEFGREAINRSRPDVILCSYPTLEFAEAALAYGRRHDVPVVLDIRDLWPDVLLNPLPRILNRLLDIALSPVHRRIAAVCRKADAIIGISQEYLAWGLCHAGRVATDRDIVVPLAYTPELAPSCSKRTAHWDAQLPNDQRYRCLFSGTMATICDVAIVVEAARILDREEPNRWQFVFCGDGPQAKAYRQQAGELSNVLFTGWIDATELGIVLDRSHLALAPYHRGVPTVISNKISDYLGAGLPVVTNRGGTLHQFLTNHRVGFEYDTGSVHSLVQTLRQARRDGEQNHSTLASRARAVYERHLHPDSVFGRFTEHLEFVRGSRSKPVGLKVA